MAINPLTLGRRFTRERIQSLSTTVARQSIAATFAMLIVSVASVHAETSDVRIAMGFGIHYLPFYVMEKEQLLEKRAKAAGLPPIKVEYLRMSGGAALNDAILSGAADFAGAGVGPFAILWDKSKGNVKAIAAMGDVPMSLLTNDPRIKTLADLKDGDRIALPAVKASMQATMLQLAAAKLLGDTNYSGLDQYTATLPHSEATTALLSGNGVVNGHFSVEPYVTREKSNPAVREIKNSTEIVGGPMSLNLVFCTVKFHQANPTIVRIMVEALRDANDFIRNNRAVAAKIYFETDRGAATDVAMVEQALASPSLNFTVVPHGITTFVGFMHRVGLVKRRPASWKDLFFPEAAALDGN